MITPVESQPPAPGPLSIATRDLGRQQVAEEEIITFPTGLPGFEDCRRFVLLKYPFPAPLRCLQSVDRPEVAFVVTDPTNLAADFKVRSGNIGLNEWNQEDPQAVTPLVIITIPAGRPQDMTANLMAPLLINRHTRRGRQVVLDKSGYSSNYQVLPR